RSVSGVQCNLNCRRDCLNGRCDPMFGYCTCPDGLYGQSCEKPCPSFTFGKNCRFPCKCAREHSEGCDEIDARSVNSDVTVLNDVTVKTEPVVTGRQVVVSVYPDGVDCNCGKYKCDPTDGKCICPVGRHGLLCEEECRAGRYGESCMNKCQCFNGASCDPKTGQCSCSPGWLGPTCQVEMLDPNNIANRGDLPEDWEWRTKR
ncbi:hypothetical protein CAEBREN_19934, partial [Caenorhabditis brenneri]